MDDKGFIDLGVPSVTLWGTTNEMAQFHEDKGIYGNSIVRDLFLYGTGAGNFLLRTVIPQNRKIKRDKFENGEIPEFVHRNPKAAIQTKRDTWDIGTEIRK